jgi:hypothetical protein
LWYPSRVLKLTLMELATVASNLSPCFRIGIASAPLFVSLAVRLLVGENRALQVVLMGAATWLAMNAALFEPIQKLSATH